MIVTKPNMQGGDDKVIMTTTVLPCFVYSLSVFVFQLVVFVCKGKYICVWEPERVVFVSDARSAAHAPDALYAPAARHEHDAGHEHDGRPSTHPHGHGAPRHDAARRQSGAGERHSSVCETLHFTVMQDFTVKFHFCCSVTTIKQSYSFLQYILRMTD